MRDEIWAWRWTLLGAAFLVGGIVRDDALALLLALALPASAASCARLIFTSPVSSLASQTSETSSPQALPAVLVVDAGSPAARGGASGAAGSTSTSAAW